MDKLITVEYNPTRIPQKEIDFSNFYGCVGETLEGLYNRALLPSDNIRSREIPVRFPLIMANSQVATFWSRKNYAPTDKILFQEEGISLPARDVCRIKRPPISEYTRRPLGNNEEVFQELFESDHYCSTFSLNTFLGVLHYLGERYSLGWTWKKEWNQKVGNAKLRSLFIEARFYGIDTAISIYNRKKIDGVVIEVIVRPWPSEKDYKEGVRRTRFRSNVYLVSNCSEYIDYVDGVALKRTKIASSNWSKKLAEVYQNLTTANEVLACRRNIENLQVSKGTDNYKYYTKGSFTPAKKANQ